MQIDTTSNLKKYEMQLFSTGNDIKLNEDHFKRSRKLPTKFIDSTFVQKTLFIEENIYVTE